MEIKTEADMKFNNVIARNSNGKNTGDELKPRHKMLKKEREKWSGRM